jgi:uncharacterized protein (DUF1015 family)
MAQLRAFSGVRYRAADGGSDGTPVIAPPYDVISPAQQQALLERDPHNIIRLELPQDEPGDDDARNRYTRAAELYREWLAAGVLCRDEEPCLYVYGQRYEVDGRRAQRLGLMGALKVEPYEAGVVLPHEQTFPKHKEDRFRLLSAARAQFSPIFGLYSAPECGVRGVLARHAAAPPAVTALDHEGVEHRLWPVADRAFAEWAAGVFAGRQVFIADGHHRYETAIRYRDHRRAETPDAPESAFDFVMTFLVEMEDPGLVLLPTHRLVRGGLPEPEVLRAALTPFFAVEEGVSLVEADSLGHHQIGVVWPDGSVWHLTLRDGSAVERLDKEHSAAWRDLDVVLLHRLIFQELLGLDEHESIVYARDPEEARTRVISGEFAAAFLLPFPRVDELKAVAGAGDRMPEKSTYFWPKAVSGLVIHGE